jgi:hypothetical protein
MLMPAIRATSNTLNNYQHGDLALSLFMTFVTAAYNPHNTTAPNNLAVPAHFSN